VTVAEVCAVVTTLITVIQFIKGRAESGKGTSPDSVAERLGGAEKLQRAMKRPAQWAGKVKSLSPTQQHALFRRIESITNDLREAIATADGDAELCGEAADRAAVAVQDEFAKIPEFRNAKLQSLFENSGVPWMR
jgi:hypothetical protein